jgi:hypothetical protein
MICVHEIRLLTRVNNRHTQVLGVANKLLTVLGNAALGGSDVSAAGLACVAAGIGGSVGYQSARRRDGAAGGAEEKRAAAVRVVETKTETEGWISYRTRQSTRASALLTASATHTPLAAAAASPVGTRPRRTRARE